MCECSEVLMPYFLRLGLARKRDTVGAFLTPTDACSRQSDSEPYRGNSSGSFLPDRWDGKLRQRLLLTFVHVFYRALCYHELFQELTVHMHDRAVCSTVYIFKKQTMLGS